jgi:type II secretory pathway pseudopilin PulG
MIKFIEGKNKTKKGFIHQNFLKKISGGFTLVETLVAVSIFSVSVIALMSFLATNISNTSYAKNKMIATYLAQEGIEYIRNIRDTYVLYPVNGDWNSFKTKLASCNSENGCGFDSSASLADSIFQCSGNRCKLYLYNGNYNTNLNGVDSGFTRIILRELVGGQNSGEIKIISTVSWTQGAVPHSITFSENLFNWVELE